MKKFKDLDCVLLVDDDIPTNFIHTKVVKNAKLQVDILAITSAREALDYLTFSGKYEADDVGRRPGIIFLDINMPGMSGWDFMEEYGRIDAVLKKRTIVIMLTTSMNPDDESLAATNREIVNYLHKPLNEDALMKIAGKYFEEISN